MFQIDIRFHCWLKLLATGDDFRTHFISSNINNNKNCPRTRSVTFLQPKDRQTTMQEVSTWPVETIRDINRIKRVHILLKQTQEILLNSIYK